MAEEITFDARKYKRYNLVEHLPVRIKTSSIKLRADKEIKGIVGNVGAGGAMLISSIFIPRGSVVEIEIPDFNGLPASLKTNSRVVHHEEPRFPLPLKTSSRVVHTQAKIISSRRDKDEHFYCMGVEFLDISDETRSTINEWIKKIMSENATKGKK
ncbi:PilZ domain-containing protein [candidate division NPL-UPA2 bacterium Unc8]|uniref:PilZ domain-containing protein n=1 Tax=candidate division NPL-UPA2 bacterium Unc8 TaxID=1980939 RepID=A0A399FZ04_UNCN2|nr:MAG: PilZ domain-containing protein [candidate division NPL-UPA2 bacterium Unc8]